MNMSAGAQAIVRVQNPIRLSRFSEPQPDVVLLRPRDDFYASAHPGPNEHSPAFCGRVDPFRLGSGAQGSPGLPEQS